MIHAGTAQRDIIPPVGIPMLEPHGVPTQVAVQSQMGIPASHLMLTAPHNHSAPITLNCGQGEQ